MYRVRAKCYFIYTVKILKIGRPKIITIVVLNRNSLVIQCSNHALKDADGMANSVDTDQTAL